jgi:hypothetical protein
VTTLVGAPPSNVVKNTQAERPTWMEIIWCYFRY